MIVQKSSQNVNSNAGVFLAKPWSFHLADCFYPIPALHLAETFAALPA